MAGPAVPKACYTLPPVESSYKPKGTYVTLNDFKIYETGNEKLTKVLICVYDIFGFHPNTQQLCDRLVTPGVFRIVMPDFFRGKPWPFSPWPPKDWKDLLKWVDEVGNYKKSLKKDIVDTIDYYKKKGATSFGMFGFCWGSKICAQTANELDIKAIGLCHPSWLELTDFDNIKCPVLFCPSKDEPDEIPFMEKVIKKLGDGKSEHHRFDDMSHGFAAARGDLNDELTRKRVNEIIGYLHSFFVLHIGDK